MATQANLLRMVRQLHLYLGTFITPAILFFAFTGALQTFSLHDIAKDGSYKPANWIVLLAQIHKKQTMQMPAPKPQPHTSAQGGGHHKSEKENTPAQPTDLSAHNPLPLKIFFLAVSLGLYTSTLTGLYMSYKYSRNKVLVTTSLLAGIVVPIVLAMV